ncbi:hypothetical protein NX862_05070 [Rhodobacter sp. KR11]|uniref:hypothetical protein n=1 Tax=Rhodobacter sp. KR11 TaxID=2974588 RepID=UPI002221D726|nr:hypothetical protein [Rhodobacter sp. KR11]MCW1918118.1 hypothetical protein [Rhodobacter sp. KR11]
MASDKDKDQTGDFGVVPRIRVIPCGGTGDRLKATLLFSPMPAMGGAINLRNWPTDMADWREANPPDLRFQPIGRGTELPRLDPDSQVITDIRKTDLPKSQTEKLTKLWVSTIAPNPYGGTIWAQLRTALDETSPKVAEAPATGTQVAEGVLGDAGQIIPATTTETPQTVNVVEVPHADLAVVLETQRALELLDTISGTKASTVAAVTTSAPVPDGTSAGAKVLKAVKEDYTPADALKAMRMERLESIKKAIFDSLQLSCDQNAAALRGMRRCGVSAADNCRPPKMDALTAATRSGLKDQVNGLLAREELATWPQHGETQPKKRVAGKTSDIVVLDPALELALDHAKQAFHTLQSTPSLARAFQFAVDLDFKVPMGADQQPYGYIWCKALGKDEILVTLCKLEKRIIKGQSHWHFWPVTSAEVLNWVTGGEPRPETLTQFDAITVLSNGAIGDNCSPRRFDITTLDVRAAISGNRARSLAVNPDDPLATDSAATTFHTAGLSLVNRHTCEELVNKLASYQHKCDPAADSPVAHCLLDGQTRVVILDAEDLTIGQRLYVGCPSQTPNVTLWRPLMARIQTFGTSGDPNRDAVEIALKHLIGPSDSARRIALDSTFTTQATRTMASPFSGTEGHLAFADQLFSVWTGAPMGVDCSAPRDPNSPVEDVLSFGRSLTLPTREPYRPFRLRYSQAYRLCLTPVFSGGASLPLEHLVETADDLFFPPAKALVAAQTGAGTGMGGVYRPYVRFLRHARIDAPVILLPSGHATRTNGPMGAEAASEMVIRSTREPASDDPTQPKASLRAKKQLAARATPSLCQRLILVPTITQDEYVRHGAFDSHEGKEQPSGAYPQLTFSRPTQSFPVTVTRYQKGISGRKFLLDRRTSVDAPPTRMADEEVKGDAIWRNAGYRQTSTWFPDPCAATLVIALRRPGQSKACKTVLCDVRKGPTDEPLPVLLTLKPAKPGEETAIIWSEGQKSPAKTGFDASLEGDIRKGSRDHALDVEIRMNAGESWEVDLWWAPTGESLARNFAILQSLGTVLDFKALDGERSLSKCREDADNLLGSNLAGMLEKELCTSADETGFAYVAPGGALAPSTKVLLSIGDVVAKLHRQHPLAQISAVKTITLTHATNQVATPPSFKVKPGLSHLDHPALKVPQPSASASDIPLYAWRAKIKSSPEAFPKDLPRPDPKETGLVIGGTVRIDLATTRALEIWGKGVLPASDAFDSADRGRSRDMKIAGTWPVSLRRQTWTAGTRQPPAFRKGLDIFGFEIAPDHSVTLPEQEVLLLRIDDLPLSLGDETGRIDLLPYFLGTADPATSGRVTHRHLFPGPEARRMKIRANAIARTAPRLTTIDRIVGRFDPWFDQQSVTGHLLGEMIEAQPLSPKEQSHFSAAQELAIPSASPPGPVVAMGQVPVFVREPVMLTPEPMGWRLVTTRRGAMRLELKRGLLTTGPDEVLGIVLWPPVQLVKGPVDKGDDRGAPPPGGVLLPDGDIAILKDFRDSDLGPGGRFVSRRGGDPVRGGGEEMNLFLRPGDFRNFTRGDPGVKLVPSVLMPVSEPSAGQAEPERLMVSLLTLTPRFDPERELWYVDLDLTESSAPDAFIRFGLVRYQPYAEPERRCSSPVVQWAQQMPDRSVMLRPNGCGGVKVQVSGPAPTRRHGSDGKKDTENAIPKMRFTVLSRSQDAEGRSVVATRLALSSDDTLPSGAPAVAINVGQRNLVTWTFELNRSQLARSGPDPQLFVEEFERFRKGTYDNEPIAPDDLNDARNWQDSGERFMERIDLKPVLAWVGLSETDQVADH